MAVKIGLIGTGTVGGGCLDVLDAHKDDYARHYGVDLEIARVCSRGGQAVAEAHGLDGCFTTDFNDVIADPEVDIVVELVGGTTVARTIVTEALKAGKHVVTANKALLAAYGEEIMDLADANGVTVAFEASVGGGIPIITPLKHSVTANNINSIMGIVNGTTNYMLSRMDEEGISYDAVLADAQAKGYAEADPTADVEGHDAAAKIAIMASIAFNSRVKMSDVYAEGITKISPLDLTMAHDMGYVVKLIAHARRSDAGIEVRVCPTMIPEDHQLAKVNGVYNAIFVTGDFLGDAMFFGEGAGAGPTATAVMSDVLDVARHIQKGYVPVAGCSCTDSLPILPIEDLETKYYLRFVVADRSGVLAAMAQVFEKHGVSVRSVTQRGVHNGSEVDLVFVTHTTQEKNIRQVIEAALQLDDVVLGGYPSVIRVQGM